MKYRIVQKEYRDGTIKYSLEKAIEGFDGGEDWISTFTSPNLEEIKQAKAKKENGSPTRVKVIEE